MGGSIAADAGNNSFSISADVMKPDLALGLDILADVIKKPTFPAGEVDLEKRGLLAASRRKTSSRPPWPAMPCVAASLARTRIPPRQWLAESVAG